MSDKLSELDEIFKQLNDKNESEISDISFKKESVSSVAVKEKISEITADSANEKETDEKEIQGSDQENMDLLSDEKTDESKLDSAQEKEETVIMNPKDIKKGMAKKSEIDNSENPIESDEKDAEIKAEEQKTIVVKRPKISSETKKVDIVNNKPVKEKQTKNKKSAKKKVKKSDGTINTSVFHGFLIAFGIIIAAFVVALGGLSLGREYLGIDKGENNITFNIPKGSTSADIADLLEENDIIEHKTFFKLIFKLKAPDTIYPGDITLQPSMGYNGIIDELATMRESYKTAKIAFPEGVTLYEVANLLEKNNVCKADDFLFEFNKAQGYDFEKQITGTENAFYAMEGYFFPDTYEFYVDDTGYNVTKIVREHFQKKFTDKMLEQMKKQNLNMNQLMTLASIVQWESGSVEDMPKVASVFINRLNDPDTFPAFQSDATSKYITKVIKNAADTTAAIDHYTECYDTYHYKGLPAGPICNPGIEAIKAVLNPEKTDYYYFCNNLKTKESFFAKTLEEHEKNLVKAGLKE